MEDVLLKHPATGAVILAGVVVLFWALGKNWKAMRAIQEELHSAIHQVVPPLIVDAINSHNRDEDAHEAAGAKVRKERIEMFNELRDRMEEQHEKIIVSLTKLETNQSVMQGTLAKVDANLTRLKAEHDRIVAHEGQRLRRDTDKNGLDFTNVRHEDICRRRTDPAGEDHTKERS